MNQKKFDTEALARFSASIVNMCVHMRNKALGIQSPSIICAEQMQQVVDNIHFGIADAMSNDQNSRKNMGYNRIIYFIIRRNLL